MTKRERIQSTAIEMLDPEPLPLETLVDALSIVFPRMNLSSQRVAQHLRGCPSIVKEVVIMDRARKTVYRLRDPDAV